MPAGDRTGKFGMGPMTGRGMGYCAGFPVPGYANPGWGFGFSRGRGRGWGVGRRGRWGAFGGTGYPTWGPYGYAYPAMPTPWYW